MGKKHSIKKFRDAWEDDEWGSEDSNRSKGKNKDKRVKEARKQKFSDRWYDEDNNIKRKKSEKKP